MDHMMMLVTVVALFALTSSSYGEYVVNAPLTREQKAFNILEIIKFPNDPCAGTGNRNGTCFTNQECEDRGGTNGGTCASGFGVCCQFTVGCGSSTAENCTYFEVAGAANGACQAEICPCNDNICQLRLDFTTFVITGPQTASTTAFKTTNGLPTAAGASSTLQSNCLTDTFSVTNPGGNSPSVICGTNTGQHMYVDSSNDCNDLVFNLGTGTSVTRNWNIKVTQLACDSMVLAPDGCTQYFFGASTGQFESFNFNAGNGQHLANQEQTICVRRERGSCRACFSAITTADFMVSGPAATSKVGAATECCQYGAKGVGVKGFDCLEIPAAQNKVGDNKNDRVCGRKKVGGDGTRCTTMTPFLARFRSDGFEFAGAGLEAATPDLGFRLGFFMDAMFCSP